MVWDPSHSILHRHHLITTAHPVYAFLGRFQHPDFKHDIGYSAPVDTISRHVAVIGTGTLGRRVGLMWASKGDSVLIVDSKSESASAALAWIEKELPSRVKAVPGTSGQTANAMDT